MRWLGSEVGLGDRGADLVCARPDDHRRDVADQRPDDGRHRRDHAAEVGVGRARSGASGRVHRDQRAGVRHRAAHRGRRRPGRSRGSWPPRPGTPHRDGPGPDSSRAAADSTARSAGGRPARRRQAGSSSGLVAGFCGHGRQAGCFSGSRSPAGVLSVGGRSAGSFSAPSGPVTAFSGSCSATAFCGGCSADACSAAAFSRTGAPPTARPSVPARASPGGPGRVRPRGRRLASRRRGLGPRPG
jgi:hypothetical protein